MAIEDLLKKNISLAGSNVISGALGSPASTISGLTGLLGAFTSPTPAEKKKIEEGDLTIGLPPGLSDLLSGISKATGEYGPQFFQEKLINLTDGYLKPETPFQQRVANISSDVGQFLGVGAGSSLAKGLKAGQGIDKAIASSFKPGVGKAVKMAGFGEIGSTGAKLMGGDIKQQEYGRLAGYAAAGLFNFNKLGNLSKNYYTASKRVLPKGAEVGVGDLTKSADQVLNVFKKGANTSWERRVARFAKTIKNKLPKAVKDKASADKKMDIETLIKLKQGFNDEMYVGKFAPKKLHMAKPIQKELYNAIEKYGNKNPEFYSYFKNAELLHSIDKRLPFLDRALNKALDVKDSGLGEYFRKTLFYATAGLKGLATKAGLKNLSKRGEAFLKSPLYRKESMKLAKATALRSMPMATDSINKLVDIYKKYGSGIKGKSGALFRVYSPKSDEKGPAIPKGKFKPISKEELYKRINKK